MANHDLTFLPDPDPESISSDVATTLSGESANAEAVPQTRPSRPPSRSVPGRNAGARSAAMPAPAPAPW